MPAAPLGCILCGERNIYGAYQRIDDLRLLVNCDDGHYKYDR